MANDPKKSIDEQNIYIRDTLMSVAANFSTVLKDAVEDAFDSTEASVLNAVGKDLTRSFTRLAKMSDDFANNQSKIRKGLLSQKDIEKQIQSIQEKRESLERKMEHTKRLMKSVGSDLSTQQLSDYALAKEALTVQEEALEIDKKTAKSLSFKIALQKGFEELKKKARVEEIAEMLTLAGIFKIIIDAGFKANEQTVQLGKILGLSYNSANDLRNSMVEYSRAAEDSFVNTDRLVKAQTELTEQLGFAVKFGNQELETFARLTEITGLTAQEAGNLAKLSAATGKTTKSYVSDLRVGAFYAQQSTKTHSSDKQILQEVSKLSTGILIKFQGNPKALAQAVVEAKKLGSSLDQIDKIGGSLLDWQSSIQNELEAELLTGKKINLEKARYAALTGDQLSLTREIADQVGTLADYQNMNVIAQGSLAKAFGLSRDEMSEMLMKQEAINKYGSEAAKLNAEQIEDMQRRNMSAAEYLEYVENQRSTQEKFNDAILKLQDLIGNLVAGPLGKMLDIISKILEHTTALSVAMSLYIGKQVFSLAMKKLELYYAKKSAKANAVDGAIEAGKSAAKVPFIGAALGIAAALASFAAFSGLLDKGDDVISPGYGKRMLLDKGSVTAFNDNDTIVAGTNLGGGRPSGGGTDMSPMIVAINELHNTLKSTANKPSVAYINGKDAFANDLGKSRYLGTSQNINTGYRVA